MSSLLRLVARLPIPGALADFEPFLPVSGTSFVISRVGEVSESGYGRALSVCRKLMEEKESVGACRLPAVKAVFFDMDSTVIKEESLVTLAQGVGFGEKVHRITERAMAGELDFNSALKERVALLSGVQVETVNRVANTLTINPGMKEVLRFCKELGVPAFLISGGFFEMAKVIAEALGFAGFWSNKFEIEGGRLTGRVEGVIVDATAKLHHMLSACAELGIMARDVAAVGDGANDLPMLQNAGVAVGHSPKAVLWPILHGANWSNDHRFLIPLLFGRGLTMTRS